MKTSHVFQFKALLNSQTNNNLHTPSWNGAVWQCDTYTMAPRYFSSGMTKWHREATKYIKYKTQKDWYNLHNIITNPRKKEKLTNTMQNFITIEATNQQQKV